MIRIEAFVVASASTVCAECDKPILELYVLRMGDGPGFHMGCAQAVAKRMLTVARDTGFGSPA